MDFDNNKPIYRQITDYCCRMITSGKWVPEGRVPSVKELSLLLTVNNRTVLKAFEELNDMGVIYSKRGLGYFVTSEAKKIILQQQRQEFMTTTLPDFINTMRILGLTAKDILPLLPQ